MSWLSPFCRSTEKSSGPNVRESGRPWSKRYNLSAEWVLKMALDAMLDWTWHHTHFDKFDLVPSQEVISERANRMSPEMRPVFLREMRKLKKRVSTASIEWPVNLYWPNNVTQQGGPDQRSFTYPEWDGYDEKLYARAVREHFERHFKDYLAEVDELAKKATKVETLTKPERFAMLALYLCRDKKLEEIGAMKIGGVYKEKSGVSKDIREAAYLIKIPLKRPGIRRGRKLQRRPK